MPDHGAAAQDAKPLLRGVSHQLAAVVAATLAPLLIVSAPGIGPRFVVALYAVAIVLLFMTRRDRRQQLLAISMMFFMRIRI